MSLLSKPDLPASLLVKTLELERKARAVTFYGRARVIACLRKNLIGAGFFPRVFTLLTLISIFFSGAAQAEDLGLSGEYQQKARLICNFLRNCKWPDRRFPLPESPFIIGICGTDLISEYLREDIQDRRIQGRPVQIRRVTQREEFAICHLIFISRSERDRLRGVLGETRRENVLTVGETDNFLSSGGVIQFANFDGQIRYLFSLEAARRERIEPNGFVLRMAAPQSAVRQGGERRLADGVNTPPTP